MLAKEDKELDRAYERLQQISADDEARIWYEVRQKGILDQRTIEVVARKKGKAEGKAEGLKEAKTEVALSALNEGMDIALIAKLTGLSEEEIKKLA